MRVKAPPEPGPKLADNSDRWPALAAMLAPAAGCDCQMLAVMLAEAVEAERGDVPAIPAVPAGKH